VAHRALTYLVKVISELILIPNDIVTSPPSRAYLGYLGTRQALYVIELRHEDPKANDGRSG
jgi:hypothetical protein